MEPETPAQEPVRADEPPGRDAAGTASPARFELRLQSTGLRWLLIVSGVLVILAGTQLFVFSERTDEYFAWTIVPPVSAAFLGAGYYAAAGMEWFAVRQRLWVSARLVSATILVFASLTLFVTLAHLDRFHFDGPTAGTIAVTWAWIAIYAGVPPLMAVFLIRHHRAPGSDPPRVAPLPGWFKVVFGIHAFLLLLLGVPMLLEPVRTAVVAWPWELTPLTGRAIAAWLLGLGFAGLFALWENDWARLRPVALSFILLIGLQAIALLRYAGSFDWSRPRSWLYVVYLFDMLVLGVVAMRATRRAGR